MARFIFNFDKIKSIKTFNKFNANGKDSPDYVVTMDYFYRVLDEIHYIFLSDKNMSSEEAYQAIDKMISIDAGRIKQMRNIVNTYYVEKKSEKDCATELIDKFYKISVVNSEHINDTIEEEPEVLEKRFYHLKQVSPTLFWNFFFKLNKNNIKFKIDFSYVVNSQNSINDDNYNFIVKTDDIEAYKIKNIFSRNKIMQKIIDVINDDNQKVKFYIAVNKDNKIDFGYLYNGDEYSIGITNFKNYDIIKIVKNCDTKYKNLALFPFMNNFKSIVKILNYYKNILISYLKNYNDIDIYMDIINDNLAIVIESDSYDIINYQYLHNLLNDNKYTKIKRDWIINTIHKDNRTFYYISL